MENINDYMPLSPDWNRERLEQLKALFPDLFTNEGQLNIDELKKVIDPQSVTETERYEFRWFGKSAAKRNAFTPSNATLQFDEKRSVNPNESENIIIEGENLEVLKLLSNGYREKIKCIYIDPPYNTGGDFVYNDNYNEDKKPYWEQTGVTEKGVKIDTNNDTNGRFHSNWLDMIFSRLLIARQLLTDDGVVFISINDIEVHHLRKLCAEVFGEDNLLAQFVWRTDGNFDNQAKVKVCHEYVIAYCKNIALFPSPPVIDTSVSPKSKLFLEEIRNTIVKNGPVNPISQIILPVDFPADFEKGIIKKRQDQWPRYLNDALVDNFRLINETVLESGWSSKDLALEYIQNGLNPISDSKNQETSFLITRTGSLEVVKKRTDNQSHVISVLNNLGNTQSTSALLKRSDIYFDYPKPVSLIKYLISMNYGTDIIVLDFFAGSGTTGQAVGELNQADSGNRKFILVQMPEAVDEADEAYNAGYTKISDITIRRNKGVVETLIEEKKSKAPNLFTNGHTEGAINGLGFKVFKLAKSNFPRVEFAPDPEKTEDENIELLEKYIAEKEAQLITAFNRDELITEILIKNGFNLNYKIEKQAQFVKNDIYLATDGEKETLICLDYVLDPETVTYFKTHTDTKFICLERALDTTKKYSLKHYMGNMFKAF